MLNETRKKVAKIDCISLVIKHWMCVANMPYKYHIHSQFIRKFIRSLYIELHSENIFCDDSIALVLTRNKYIKFS